MSTAADAGTRWLLKPAVVGSCIKQLFSQRIHPSFSFYLCLKRLSFRRKRTDGLRPDLNEFFGTFFRVNGDSAGRPFFRPFWDEEGKIDRAWLNPNLAGSFAPSSFRAESPFRRVVDVSAGPPPSYSLLSKHAELAHLHLAYNR